MCIGPFFNSNSPITKLEQNVNEPDNTNKTKDTFFQEKKTTLLGVNIDTQVERIKDSAAIQETVSTAPRIPFICP